MKSNLSLLMSSMFFSTLLLFELEPPLFFGFSLLACFDFALGFVFLILLLQYIAFAVPAAIWCLNPYSQVAFARFADGVWDYQPSA